MLEAWVSQQLQQCQIFCEELLHSSPYLNPNWHELWKQEKWSSLEPSRGIFYKAQWAWQGVRLIRLVLIFTSKKVWKFLIKIQLPKIWSKKDRGWKVPCLMPIRVKPSISSQSKPPMRSRTRSCTRCLKCFVSEHSVFKTKHFKASYETSYEALND